MRWFFVYPLDTGFLGILRWLKHNDGESCSDGRTYLPYLEAMLTKYRKILNAGRPEIRMVEHGKTLHLRNIFNSFDRFHSIPGLTFMLGDELASSGTRI